MAKFAKARQCTGKIAYASERDARRRVGPVARSRGFEAQLDAYFCEHCGFFHKGNKLLAVRDYKNRIGEELDMLRACAMEIVDAG